MEEKQKWHFFNLYCMAVADGSYSPQELETLYKIAEEHGFTQEKINVVVLTAGLTPIVPDDFSEKISYLYDFARMAWADGVIDPSERVLMRKYVNLFGFEPDNTDGIIEYLLEKAKSNTPVEEIINEINQ